MPEICPICTGKTSNLMLNGMEARRCDGCGLMWLKRLILNQDYYETSYEVNLTEEKVRARKRNCVDRIKTIGKYVRLDNLCDIGTGDGLFLKVLGEQGGKELIGIEPNPALVEFGKRNGINVHEGGLGDFRGITQGRKVNTVTMFHVVEHLKDPVGEIQQIAKSLNPGTCLVIETPDMQSYKMRETNYKNDLVYPEHLYYFNNLNLKMLLRNTGFKIVAHGRRDFDPGHLSIKESLFKLGLGNLLPASESLEKRVNYSPSAARNSNNIQKIPRVLVRSVLNHAVPLLRRQDYLWVIAIK